MVARYSDSFKPLRFCHSGLQTAILHNTVTPMTRLALPPQSSRFRYLPVSLFSLIIFVSSELHVPGLLQNLSDHLLHFTCYALLCMLAWYALGTHFPAHRHPARLTLSVVYAVLLGSIDEIHQAFVPFRTSSGTDIAADALGALFATALILFVSRRTI